VMFRHTSQEIFCRLREIGKIGECKRSRGPVNDFSGRFLLDDWESSAQNSYFQEKK
jgi:hypothetical protein